MNILHTAKYIVTLTDSAEGANKICYKYKVCKCTDDEQYEVRLNVL